MTLCSPLKVNRCFGGTCRLLQETSRQQLSKVPASHWFLPWRILWPWRWRRHVPQKHRLTFNGLHYVISQNIELFRRSQFTASNTVSSTAILILRVRSSGRGPGKPSIFSVRVPNMGTETGTSGLPDMKQQRVPLDRDVWGGKLTSPVEAEYYTLGWTVRTVNFMYS
jgi:hypothetical protein